VQKERKIMREKAELLTMLGDDPPILLERETMGMIVQVSHVKVKKENLFILEAETEACHKIAEIPQDKVMHAFYHPSLYVADPSDLFPKSKSL
jgi:hypothetical protein